MKLSESFSEGYQRGFDRGLDLGLGVMDFFYTFKYHWAKGNPKWSTKRKKGNGEREASPTLLDELNQLTSGFHRLYQSLPSGQRGALLHMVEFGQVSIKEGEDENDVLRFAYGALTRNEILNYEEEEDCWKIINPWYTLWARSYFGKSCIPLMTNMPSDRVLSYWHTMLTGTEKRAES